MPQIVPFFIGSNLCCVKENSLPERSISKALTETVSREQKPPLNVTTTPINKSIPETHMGTEGIKNVFGIHPLPSPSSLFKLCLLEKTVGDCFNHDYQLAFYTLWWGWIWTHWQPHAVSSWLDQRKWLSVINQHTTSSNSIETRSWTILLA